MCPLHSNDFSTGIPSRFLCPSLLCYSNIRRVFGQFCRFCRTFRMGFFDTSSCPLEGISRSKLFRIALFGPAAPPRYSRQDFGPSNCFFWASSAFKLFEAGLRSLELFLSGQQRLQVIRGRTLVPRIVSFGPAAPSSYSRQDFGPSNCFFRASSAFKLFEAGLWSLELSFRASCAFKIFEAGFRSLELSFRASRAFELFALLEIPIYPTVKFSTRRSVG
jgi:hypothetical protein